MRYTIDLSGEWNMTMEPIEGTPVEGVIILPGTTAQQRLGVKNPKHEEGYLTEDYPFSGKLTVTRKVRIGLQPGMLAELYLERTRITRVWLDGREMAAEDGTENSLIAAHRYNLTSDVTGEDQELRIEISNTGYPVPGGHMTSPDTQTNWCGITGELSVRLRPAVYIENMRTVTDLSGGTAAVEIFVYNSSDSIFKGRLRLSIEDRTCEAVCEFPEGRSMHSIGIPAEGLMLWDELERRTCPVICELSGEKGDAVDSLTLNMGFRDFRPDGRKLRINGREIFLRGKHDGLVFPLEGAAPTDVDSWLRVMSTAKDYGINHYRFHTCCPPDAAFTAADMLGIYMSPELPFWGTIHAKDEPDFDAEGQEYLIREGERLLMQFCHHPSFVMLSMGNELWGSAERLNEIIARLKKTDPHLLMTQGSNNFQFIPCILPEEDYFVGVRFAKERLFRGSYAMCDEPLGPVQTREPGTDWNYEEAILGSKGNAVLNGVKEPGAGESSAKEAAGEIEIQFGTGVKKVSASDGAGAEELVPEVPVISHEIGQYSMYPDIRRAGQYTGALRADNFEIYRKRLEEKELLEELPAIVRDSGALAMQCYKSELEAAYRTEALSGFQLLDLQDFPGQGGAYVGVLDAFMNSKGLISPEEWREFCDDIVLLAVFPGHIIEEGRELPLEIWIRNMHSGRDISEKQLDITLSVTGIKPGKTGARTETGIIYDEQLRLPEIKEGLWKIAERRLKMPMLPDGGIRKLTLSLSVEGENIRNHYSFRLFPELPEYRERDDVLRLFSDGGIRTAVSAEQYRAAVKEGGKLLYIPDKIEKSIPGDYPSDFWCYPMFRSISESMGRKVPIGTLGLSMDPDHPALKGFAFESFSAPEWYQIISHGYPAILDGTGVTVLVRDIDNIERCHDLGLIFEYREGETDVLVVASPLLTLLEHAEVRALLRSILGYMSSEAFRPEVPGKPWTLSS